MSASNNSDNNSDDTNTDAEQPIPKFLKIRGFNKKYNSKQFNRFLKAVLEDCGRYIVTTLLSFFDLYDAKSIITDNFEFLEKFDMEKFGGENRAFLLTLRIDFFMLCNVLNKELLAKKSQLN